MPKRLSPLVQPGMKPPSAIRIVAGTRELSVPARNARQAPGSEATKFTTTATARPSAPMIGQPVVTRSTRAFGMKMYAE